MGQSPHNLPPSPLQKDRARRLCPACLLPWNPAQSPSIYIKLCKAGVRALPQQAENSQLLAQGVKHVATRQFLELNLFSPLTKLIFNTLSPKDDVITENAFRPLLLLVAFRLTWQEAGRCGGGGESCPSAVLSVAYQL